MDNMLKIINNLGKKYDKTFTMHELAKILKIPYASFHRKISEISDLLIIKKIGKSKTLKLNTKSQVMHSYLAISSEEEKKAFLKNNKVLSIIQKELNTKDIVLLFGSYAKSKEHEKSDIDLMIINKSGKISLSFSKHEMIFEKKINPLFFKEHEFKAMLKDKEENVGKQALRDHIILNNPERFWNVVIDAI